MADPLVTPEQVEVRLGRSLAGAEVDRTEALIADVSGEVYLLVGDTAFHDEDDQLDVPQVVVGVVCEAVIRRIENPRGLTGENIGDYGWQANNARGGTASIYLTAAERRTVRRAAGLSSAGSIQLEGDLPLGPVFFDMNTLT